MNQEIFQRNAAVKAADDAARLMLVTLEQEVMYELTLKALVTSHNEQTGSPGDETEDSLIDMQIAGGFTLNALNIARSIGTQGGQNV